MRPGDVSLVRFTPPGWVAAEGWSLTPETAGMARLMGRGPSVGPISAFIRRRSEAVTTVIGGRNLGAPDDPAVRFTVAIDGRDLTSWDVAPSPGFFLRVVPLPAGALSGEGTWAELTLRSAPVSGERPVPSSIEQFDVQSPGVLMWAYGDGFHEPELDNARALAWRWMSDRAIVQVPQAAGDFTLVVRGESPLRYFDRPSTFEARIGDTVLGRVDLSGDFTLRFGVLESRLTASGGQIVLTTTQTFAPADRTRSADRRRLGLRLFAVEVEPGVQTRASTPNSAQNASIFVDSRAVSVYSPNVEPPSRRARVP
jgi:hypothetical protein